MECHQLMAAMFLLSLLALRLTLIGAVVLALMGVIWMALIEVLQFGDSTMGGALRVALSGMVLVEVDFGMILL